MHRKNRRRRQNKKLMRVRRERAEAAAALATCGLEPTDLTDVDRLDVGAEGGSALLEYGPDIRRDLILISRYGFSDSVSAAKMKGVEHELMEIARTNPDEKLRERAARTLAAMRTDLVKEMMRAVHPPGSHIGISIPTPPAPHQDELDVVDAEVIESVGDQRQKDAIFSLLQMEQSEQMQLGEDPAT